MNEHGMTDKQIAFADFYIELGNATQAYLKAYTNVTKETTASAAGSRMLTNVNVSAYIGKRMEELKSERVADQQEILETLTAILRGEKRGTALVGVGMGAQNVEDVPPTITEIRSAAELLGKRYAMWTDKQQTEHSGSIQFVDDIGDGDET